MIRIECRDVWKRFDEKRVLRGVNLVVEPANRGHHRQSGTGKSVFSSTSWVLRRIAAPCW